MRTIQDLTDRLRAEYLEMPGLRLTVEQVQRLCGIERTICGLILDSLVASKFLCRKQDGHYSRVTDGDCSRATSRKAILRIDQHSKKAS
jgi:hypothetical protein